MLEKSEIVAQRYRISREAQDEYALESQRHTASEQRKGRFDADIVPLQMEKRVIDKASGESGIETATLACDESNWLDMTREPLALLKPVKEGGVVITGNARQVSDGASGCVMMERRLGEQRWLDPLGLYRGSVVTKCEPGEMGVGPIFVIPKLLERHGLMVGDVDLWELNEAFVVQALYCRAPRFGVDPAKYHVDGGAISAAYPYSVSGARMAGHALIERRRCGEKRVVVTMCVGCGMGAAGPFDLS